jgi:phage shock protein E
MNESIDSKTLQKQQASNDKPIVIDVRGPEEYRAGHVPGAINIPLAELETRQGELPKDKVIVPYCTMLHPGNSRGERAASLLKNLGFDAKVLGGGFSAWQAQGLGAEKENTNILLNG